MDVLLLCVGLPSWLCLLSVVQVERRLPLCLGVCVLALLLAVRAFLRDAGRLAVTRCHHQRFPAACCDTQGVFK
ncbi:hypothetical protein FKM82_022151 [Ascaphus truei]